MLDKCNDYIKMAAVEIRNLSHQLTPAFLNDSKLEEAFEALLKSFNIENKYSIGFHYNKSMNKENIPLELQLNLYRILQEQLKNIYKYAEATTIEVDILIYNNKLRMSSSDNGKEFDITKVKKDIGLANIKRRAELFSGILEIDAALGKGCIITVGIPIT